MTRTKITARDEQIMRSALAKGMFATPQRHKVHHRRAWSLTGYNRDTGAGFVIYGLTPAQAERLIADDMLSSLTDDSLAERYELQIT